MKTELINKIKNFFDRLYDIITVQLIGTVIFILIALTIKFIGGDLYNTTRNLYYSAINSTINSEIVTNNENLINSVENITQQVDDSSIYNDLIESYDFEEYVPSNATLTTGNIFNDNYIWPLIGQITANYGDISSLFSGPDSSHTGIDISAVTGTKISATASGEIIYSGYSEGFGYHIIIRHSKSISSVYAHCSELLYKQGTFVNKGDVIALVGSSGKATGPHLHFEFLSNGKSIDPLWLLPSVENI